MASCTRPFRLGARTNNTNTRRSLDSNVAEHPLAYPIYDTTCPTKVPGFLARKVRKCLQLTSQLQDAAECGNIHRHLTSVSRAPLEIVWKTEILKTEILGVDSILQSDLPPDMTINSLDCSPIWFSDYDMPMRPPDSLVKLGGTLNLLSGGTYRASRNTHVLLLHRTPTLRDRPPASNAIRSRQYVCTRTYLHHCTYHIPFVSG